jgi:hypothetical protein
MGNRGEFAGLGWPIVGALLVVLVTAPLESPGPPQAAKGTDAPEASGPSDSGAVAFASPVASPVTSPDAGTSTRSEGPGPTAGATVATTPGATIGPTSGPTAARPTLGPTPGPAVVPTPLPAAAPTANPTVAPPTAGPIPPLSACAIFPSTNVWNRRVDGLPVASNSSTMIDAIGLDSSLHPDFSNAGGYGIPFNVVGASTPRSTVTFLYDGESDHVGYPIPATPKVEGGSDRHLLMVDTNDCMLYELFAASHGSSGWSAGSGAVWDLGSNALRTAGWTSADAAGLPIFPGLIRYSEVANGVIGHAIRFTAPDTCDGYVYPARHEAGDGSCSVDPPMGLRVRLKATVDISAFGPQSRVILTALQRYGMLLADNGSPWYITGAPDSHWNDDELHDLGQLIGSDFEVVDTTGFVNG